MSYDPNFFNRPEEENSGSSNDNHAGSTESHEIPVRQPEPEDLGFFAGSPTYSSGIEAFDTDFAQPYQSQPTQALPHVAAPTSNDQGAFQYANPQEHLRNQQIAAAQSQISQDDYGFEEEESEGIARSVIEWIIVFAGAVFLAFIIRTFLLQAFWIPSPSMTDTLMVGDRILVNKVNYRVSDVQRFDVVVFKNPDPTDENEELVKRVIGLPGETFEMRAGEVFINGTSIGAEAYVADSTLDTMTFSQVTVPDDSYFVLGDNRSNSSDSRSSLGPIHRDLIVGKAFLKFYPFDRVGRVQ